MTRLTSQLVMELLDRVSAPAQRVAESLRRITGAVGDVTAGQMGMGQRLDAAISRNNAALSSARMGMVDAAAGAYLLHRALGGPVRVAAEFERGMNRVGVLSSATEDQMGLLSQQARELGRATMFSATQVTEGMGFLAQAGFGAEQILGAMPGTLQLAAAGQMDLAQAADITSNVLTGYGFGVDQLSRVNDVLAASFSSANTDLAQLGEAMKYAGPVANAAGVGFEQAAAALSLMGNAGIQGSMAGTSLRGAISRILSPTSAAAAEMDALGLQFTDAAGRLRPLDEIVRQLEPHADDAGLMMRLFGQRAGPAMSALVGMGADELATLTEELENSGGTAERIASVEMEGFRGRMQALWSAVEGLQLSIGNALLPALTQLAEAATDALGPITALAEAYPEVTAFVVAATASVVAFKVALASLRYIGLLGKGGVLSLLALGFNTVGRAAIGAHAAAKSAIGLQVALAGMAGQPITMLDRLRAGLGGIIIAVPGLGRVGAALRVIAGIGLGKVGAAIGAIALAGLTIRKYWDRIGAFVGGFVAQIGAELSPLVEVLQPVFDWLAVAFEPVSAAWSRSAELIRDTLGGLWDWLGGLFSREILGEDERAAVEDSGRALAARLVSGIRSAVMLVPNVGMALIEMLQKGAVVAWEAVQEWARTRGMALADAVIAQADELAVAGVLLFSDLLVGARDTWSNVAAWASDRPAAIAEAIAVGAVAVRDAGAALIQSLWDGAVATFTGFLEWISDIPRRIVEAIGSIDLSGAIRWPSMPGSGGQSGAGEPTPGAQSVIERSEAAGWQSLPARARGGRVSRGAQYQVGERGWEIFSPTRSGYIFPHNEALDMMLAPLGRLPDMMRRDPLAGVMAPVNLLNDRIPRETAAGAGPVRVEVLQSDEAPVVPRSDAGSRPALPPVSITIGSLSIQGSGEPADVSRLVARVRSELEREMRAAMRAVYADTGVRTY